MPRWNNVKQKVKQQKRLNIYIIYLFFYTYSPKSPNFNISYSSSAVYEYVRGKKVKQLSPHKKALNSGKNWKCTVSPDRWNRGFADAKFFPIYRLSIKKLSLKIRFHNLVTINLSGAVWFALPVPVRVGSARSSRSGLTTIWIVRGVEVCHMAVGCGTVLIDSSFLFQLAAAN